MKKTCLRIINCKCKSVDGKRCLSGDGHLEIYKNPSGGKLMSYTEIFAFGSDGKVKAMTNINNAWHGAMAIWQTLEKKYLPSLPKPEWAKIMNEHKDYYSRTSVTIKNNIMKEIWNLADDKRLSRQEVIVLSTTFDYVLVKRENLPELIKAFNDFDGNTNLKEQAKAIEKLIEDPDITAIGWNQTSVNGDNWDNFNYDQEKGESYSYNYLTQDKHYWLQVFNND